MSQRALDIDPNVEVHVGYSPTLNRAILTFGVSNGAGASNAIEVFGVTNLAKPTGVRSPNQWVGWYGWQGNDSAIVWVCMDSLTPPPPDWDGDLRRSPFTIDPGDTVHSFSVFTDMLPESLHFYAQGYDTMPSVNDGGNTLWAGWSRSIALVDAVPSGVRSDNGPSIVVLGLPGPNPMRDVTRITFWLPGKARVRLRVFDVRGGLVRALVEGERERGLCIATWDGRDGTGRECRPGAYFARLTVAGKEIAAKRIILLR